MRIFSKRRISLMGLVVGATIALSAAAIAAVTWGPNRTTYTWAHPATKVTFNSFTDNPVWGDERYLIKARNVNESTANYATTKSVTDNQEYLVALYFHNNADSSLNLTANGVKAKITVPSASATSTELRGDISADNSDPGNVFSTMDFVSANGDPFTLEYVPGSAHLKTNYVDMALSDSVVNGFTPIGTSGADGQVQGCAQFSGYVTIKLKVHSKKTNPDFGCKLLTVDVGTNREVTAHVDYTADNGAVFKNVKFNWGDGQSTLTDQTSAKHTYGKDDNYVIDAILTFNVGQTTKTAICSHSVSINTKTKEVTKVTTLPNTGPGAVAGLFAGASGLAGLGHYVIRRRR